MRRSASATSTPCTWACPSLCSCPPSCPRLCRHPFWAHGPGELSAPPPLLGPREPPASLGDRAEACARAGAPRAAGQQ
eukprot:9015368-Alexandrium_andersonii.AAC.1